MTRSSTNKLFTPYKEPEREFRSSRRHFKTLSLDELRSPDFNLLSDQEYSEEEEAEAMAETMEQYMSKTRTDYGSGVARPKIEEKDSFELKGQFLKELRENTFSGSDNEDTNEHIKKVLKIVDLFHVPNITMDQLMLRVETAKKMEEINNFQQETDETLYQAWERFKELLMKCPQHYLTKMQEVILFYNGLDIPTRQILDSRGYSSLKEMEDNIKMGQWNKARSTKTSDGLAAIQAQLNNLRREIKKVNKKVYAAQVGWQYRAAAPGFYQRNDENPSYKKRRQSIEESLSKFMNESAKRHKENSNMIKEIQASTDNSTLLYKSRQTTVPFPSHLDNHYCKEEEGNHGPKFMEACGTSHINNTVPQKEKDPGSFTLPCFINDVCFDNALVDLGVSISVMPLSTYLNLGLGKLAHTRLTVELANRTMKYPKGIAENVLVGV
ncbi:NUDIX hydrolase 6-like protein, partial [Tanacetum coccineum]